MHTKPTVLVLQFRRQGAHGHRHMENPKNRLSYNKTKQTATFLTFPCSPVQVLPAHANTEAVHSSYWQQEVHNSLGFSPRRSAARQKIHAKSTVQVSWYPRVQFKVRVSRAPVVTGTVPVVLYILVRSWKDVISMVRAASASAKRAYIKVYAAQ